MNLAGRAFLVVVSLLFGATMSGLCLCPDHLALIGESHSGEDVHAPARAEAEGHGHDHGSHSHSGEPTRGSSDCGGCGSGDGNPFGTCCCAADAHRWALHHQVTTTCPLQATEGTPACVSKPVLSPEESSPRPRHPPPNEGFKLWPEVPLFLQLSSFLL